MNHDVRMTAPKIAQRLALIEPLVYRRRFLLPSLRYHTLDGPHDPPPLAPHLDDQDWPVLAPGTTWGGPDINFVMRGYFQVPLDSAADGPWALVMPLGEAGEFSHPEALVYIDGRAYATVDRHHQELLLAPTHGDGQPHRLVLHGWTGTAGTMWPVPGGQLPSPVCAVVEIDAPTRAFVAAARTALQAANLLDDLVPAKTRLYNVLDAAFKALDTREPLGEAFYASVPDALSILRTGITQAGSPLDVDIIAAGHAHIDVAWLWTLGQTRHKTRRTFYTALRLLEQFPAYSFTQSQPQLYDFVRQDDPALFAAIQQRVAQGRWEPIGGMWVEADCNISGPESLARQFLLGRQFFRQYFGPAAESPVLWLPDVFGYAWNLPQLIKQAGLDYFFTIKIGWNQVNQLPYDSFWWQGLDGTRVLTHFSPTPDAPWRGEPVASDLRNFATYNAQLTAFAALGSWAKAKHKEAQRVVLMSYGYGDGGGGPTREMNENARELQAFPGLPRVQQGKVLDFFRLLDAQSGDQLPTWNNELYLEIHRGTYTTQGRSKRANRQSEFLLHDAEFLATLASVLDPDYAYPHTALHQAWQLVCLNQFHDIIPGSSIGQVYVESLQQYAQVRQLADAARDSALDAIRAQFGGDVLLVNPTSFWRKDLAFWPGALPAGQRLADGLFTQPVVGGTLIGGMNLAPYSVTPLTCESGASTPLAAEKAVYVEPARLENAYIRVEFNIAGDITRIYDKTALREVLPAGALANQFQAFEDRPLNWDAWDVDIFYDDKLFLAGPAAVVRVVESGPLRATLEMTRRILNSEITQRVSLTYNSPLIIFGTTVDWHERHILLKTAFPVDVLSPMATYEIQWGNVQRPTHRNTSWDWARFETCAQKWVDLSEGGFGVALLNDCKYGHDIHDNVIRLSLLRSPTQPDPAADQGRHQFVYALSPHGDVRSSAIAGDAYALNDPLLAVSGKAGPNRKPWSFVTASPHVIIETIKRAEDGHGVIVRLYECNRQRGWVTVHAGFPIAAAWLTNLLEEDQEPLEVVGQDVRLFVKPFQIVTIRLCRV